MRFYRKDAIKTSSNNQVYENADDTKVDDIHCVKSVRIPSYSGPHFPIFGLNTERYGVNAGQNDPEYGHFSRSDSHLNL